MRQIRRNRCAPINCRVGANFGFDSAAGGGCTDGSAPRRCHHMKPKDNAKLNSIVDAMAMVREFTGESYEVGDKF